MSHTMHRMTDSDDFVLHIRPPKNASEGTGKILASLLKNLIEFHPVNIGSPSVGNMITSTSDALAQKWTDGTPLHAIFDSEENFIFALRYLKQANTGFSVSISVPWKTAEILSEREDFSIAGYQVDLTPSALLEEGDWVMRICSLCGHLRISPAQVRHLAEKIRINTISPEQAALELGKNCLCGCFNTSVAKHLLEIGAEENNNL